MIKLFSFGSKFGVADPSPFVLKVDCYYRMAGIEYTTVVKDDNLRHAPKGKLPFIDLENNLIPDSQWIIEAAQKAGADLDDHLSEHQKAIAYLITKSLDENLYFVLVYSRWAKDDTWPILKEGFFGSLPIPLKWILPKIIRNQVLKMLKGQGIAKHSDHEIQHVLRRSLDSLSTLLAEKDFLFGENPSSLDATAYGLLAEFISVEFDNPFNQIAKSYPSLVSYCQRIEKRYY
jgi:glutathione S-transferase-like protein